MGTCKSLKHKMNNIEEIIKKKIGSRIENLLDDPANYKDI